MIRPWLAAATLVLSASVAHAKLEIQSVQAVFGPLGPERKSLDCYPYDDLCFRFSVTGFRVGKEGRPDCEMLVSALDPKGKLHKETKVPLNTSGIDLGGGSMPVYAGYLLNEQDLPGEYRLLVSIKDKLSSESASFQRKLTLKATEFALVSPRFFLDTEGRVAAPAGGLVGQMLHFRLLVIGFDRAGGKADLEMQWEVLDAKGNERLSGPDRAVVRSVNAEEVKKAMFVTFWGGVILNRPGSFLLRVTVTDRQAKKTLKLEMPLRVSAPE